MTLARDLEECLRRAVPHHRNAYAIKVLIAGVVDKPFEVAVSVELEDRYIAARGADEGVELTRRSPATYAECDEVLLWAQGACRERGAILECRESYQFVDGSEVPQDGLLAAKELDRRLACAMQWLERTRLAYVEMYECEMGRYSPPMSLGINVCLATPAMTRLSYVSLCEWVEAQRGISERRLACQRWIEHVKQAFSLPSNRPNIDNLGRPIPLPDISGEGTSIPSHGDSDVPHDKSNLHRSESGLIQSKADEP